MTDPKLYITPNLRQHYTAGQCRPMPPGKWRIHGLSVRPIGADTDAVIEATMWRRAAGNVVWHVLLSARGPEMREGFDCPVVSRAGSVELVVRGGEAWVEVRAETAEGCPPSANPPDCADST